MKYRDKVEKRVLAIILSIIILVSSSSDAWAGAADKETEGNRQTEEVMPESDIEEENETDQEQTEESELSPETSQETNAQTESETETEMETEAVGREAMSLDLLLDSDEEIILITNEEELLDELAKMKDGDSKTLRLVNSITLTKSMQLTRNGTYSVTIIGDGEKTIISADASMRLFTLKNGTINLTLNNVILDGNNMAGGVVVSDKAKLTLNGSGNSIIRNMKDTHGGALRASDAAVELANLTMKNNTADKNGGAVYAYSSRIDASNVTFRENKAGEDGGAIYQYDTSGTIQIKSSVFTGNTAGNYGGAIAGSSTGLTLQQTTVSGNKAKNGGGVFLRTGAMSAQLNVTNSSSIAGNTAEYNGGGIYVESATAGVNLTTSSVVENNKAENGNGGGLYLNQSSNVHVNNATVSGNGAKNGGGLFIFDSNTLTCVNSMIKGNTASENGGGAYCSVTSSISSTTFSGNEAKNGGGLYNSNSTKIILNSSLMENNIAKENGGAIGLDENSWNISAGMNTFRNNEAAYSVEKLNAADQVIHDTIMMVNTGYGTVNYTYPFEQALNNYDVWNTGASAGLVFDANVKDPDEVEGLPRTQNYAIGASILLPIETPVRNNYTFLGWAEDKAASVPKYVTNPDASSKEEQDLWYTMKQGTNTLYAVWELNSMTVSFDANGGSLEENEAGEKQVEHGSAVESLPSVNKRFGYEFIGWYDKNAGEDLETVDSAERDKDWGNKWNAESPVNQDITLYARWKQVPFPIGNNEFGDEYEQLLSEALNSTRATINIHLYDDIELTDAMRVGNMADTGLVVNFFSQKKTAAGNIDQVKLIQTGQERHFYIRNAGTKAVIRLNNVHITSSSGYGGIEVSKGLLTVNGSESDIGGNYPRITGINKHFSGGAIHAKDGAKVTLNKIDLISNKADYGGAISAEGKDTEINLKDVTLILNKAELGGGVDLSDGAELIMENRVYIKSNQAAHAGGGLYVSDETVSVEGKDAEFSENKAGTHGGAIGLGVLGSGGEELLGNITLSDSINWSNNEAASAYVVDKIKEEDIELYKHLSGNSTEVWNGNHISYLYNIYTVNYDMDGAPASTPTDSVRYGEGYELALPGPDKVNLDGTSEPWKYRSFVGWSQNRYESDIKNAKNKLTFAGDINEITLYPVWEHEMATVTFNPGVGGSFGDGSEDEIKELIIKLEKAYPDYTFAYDSGTGFIKVTVEKGTVLSPPDSGYLMHSDDKYFQYWYKSSTPVVEHFDFDTPVVEDITLSAKWGVIEQDKALLTFHTNGGNHIDPITLMDGDPGTLTDYDLARVESVTKSGYEFAGWYTDEAFMDGTKWNPRNFTYRVGENHDIYAKWEIKSYKLTVKINPDSGGNITINQNDVISKESEKIFVYGTTVTLKAVANDGYYFAGWSITPDLHDGYNLSDMLEIILTEDTTVTATFAKKTHVVTFYEGRRLLQTLEVEHGGAFAAGQVPKTPEGYTQTWYTGSDPDRKEVIFSDNNTVTESIVYERELKAEEYTVTLHGKKGTIGGADKITKTVRYNEAVGNLDEKTEEVTRPYYKFAGWSASKDYNRPWNLVSDTVHGNLDIYAIWDTIDAPAPELEAVEVFHGKLIQIDLDDPKTLEIETGLTSFLARAKASIPDPYDEEGDVLTYRWVVSYENQTTWLIKSDSELIQYVASFSKPGTYYCYLEVTNTNANYSGKKSAMIRSEIMTIEVIKAPPRASRPLILEDPEDLSVKAGQDAEFKVNAKSPDQDIYGKDADGEEYSKLTYQWYELTEAGPKIIEGAINEKYSFTTDMVGEFLYYVVVTNTLTDPGDPANITAEQVISETAKLTVWTDYTVTYHSDSADRGQPPEDKNTYDAGDEVTALDAGSMEKDNHTFIGWTTDKDGADIILKSGETFRMPEANVNFYPVWKKNIYSVIYLANDADGGQVPVDNKKYKTGETVKILDNEGKLAREGYIFIGWLTDPDDNESLLKPGQTIIMEEKDIRLTAAWDKENDPATYSVLYYGEDADSGQVPVDNKKYKTGETVKILDNEGKLAREGYIFIGWLTDPDDNGSLLKPGQTIIMEEKDIRLTAAWDKENDPATYSVLYYGEDAESGQVPVDNKKYKTGETVKILDNEGKLAREGYIFIGWLTDPDDNESLLKPGQTIIIEEKDIRLTAAWDKENDPATYSVLYYGEDAESGQVPVDNKKYKTGETVKILDNEGKLAREGYIFIGWLTNPDDNESLLKPGQTIIIEEKDIRLTAAWDKENDPVTYSVFYHIGNADSGHPPKDNNKYKEGDEITLLDNTGELKKDGSYFMGWTTEQDGTGIILIPGHIIWMQTEDINLYPAWKKEADYSVIYSAGGAESGYPPVDSNRYRSGETVTILGNSGELTRTGYIFKGWLAGDGDQATLLQADETIIMGEGDIYLTAAWDEEPVPVTYAVFYCDGNADSGSTPIDSNRYKAGDAITILDNTGELKKAGYVFAGWSLNLKGTGDIYKAGMKITMGESDLILYAVWQEEPEDSDPIVKPEKNKKKNTGISSGTGKKSGASTSTKKAAKSPKTGDLTTERYPIILLLSSAAVLILLKKKRFISK